MLTSGSTSLSNSKVRIRRSLLHLAEELILEAFGRVDRIGQESETFVTRLVVKRTMDERLEEMQIQKEKAIDEALSTNQHIAGFTVKELMKLFGPVVEDQEGHAFILVDDEKEPREDTPQPKRRNNGMSSMGK